MLRILLVDEHEPLRRGVRLMLSALTNVEVCGEATNGLDAIAKARELRPDIIITPIGLPGMNGLDAAREIRRTLPNIQLVVFSEHDIPQARDEAVRAGATAFVSKSSVWDLVSVVQKLQPPAASSAANSSH